MSMIPSMRTTNPLDRRGALLVGTSARARYPGPTGPWSEPGCARKAADVERAWNLARARDLDRAIRNATSDEFHRAVQGAIDPLVLAVGGAGWVPAGGPTSVGIVAAPGPRAGVLPGAQSDHPLNVGFAMGLLSWLGLSQLARHLGGRLEVVDATLGRGLRTAWDSGGETTAVDAAAHEIADAFGLFFVHVLHAIVAEIVGQPAGLSDEFKVRRVAARLRPTRLGASADDLGTFLVRNHARLLADFTTGSAVKRPPTRL
jgi:hypothetical protein